QTADSGYIIVGAIYNSTSNWDILLIKTDNDGEISWNKSYGGNSLELSNFVQQSSDGGFIICGYTQSFGTGDNDAYLLKTDSLGNLLWTRTYGEPNSNDAAVCVRETNNGGYVFCGYLSGIYCGSIRTFYLARIDLYGDTLWTRTYSGLNQEAGGRIVYQTPDSGFVVLGTSHSSNNDHNICLFKTDFSGNIQWAKTYGGPYIDAGISMEISDNGYVLLGRTLSYSPYDVCLIKTNFFGDTLWTKNYGLSFMSGNSFSLSNDGGYSILSTYMPTTLIDSGIIYLVKTDSFGNSPCISRNFPITASAISLRDTITATIVDSGGAIGIPLYTTGSGTIIADPCIINDTTNPQMDNFFVYPNPSDGHFRVNARGVFRVYNALGEMIYNEELSGQETVIDLSQKSTGVYYLLLINDSRIFTKKLFIQK
ncbi:MAG: T9SS type A sorting domain-containing protein, partial [Bacteroidota bacterium]